MAAKIHGRLAAVGLVEITSGGLITPVYTVPAGRKATVTISIYNRAASQSVLMFFGASGSAAVENNFDAETLAAGAVYERSGITMAAGQSLGVQAATSPVVTAQVWGIEEDI